MNIALYHMHFTSLAPEELIFLYPHQAQYGSLSLFITGSKNPSNVVDWASMGFNHPYNPEGVGITSEQLDTLFEDLVSPEQPPIPDEVRVSKVQFNYIYETRFKPEPELGILP